MSRTPDYQRDLKIFEFIQTYAQSHGFPPSQRQIQRSLRIKHLFSVQRSLARLKTSKQISKIGLPVRKVSEHTTIPLLGLVAAGSPIEAIENPDDIEVPAWMLKANHNYFVLRVKGNSMIEDGIFNHDLVLIREQNHAKNGDTVVALVNGEATLKKYFKKANRILLLPANSDLKPIEVSPSQSFRIAGIYAGVLRSTE